MSKQEFFSAKEVGAILNLSPTTIYRMACKGEIKAVWFGDGTKRTVRIHESQINKIRQQAM
jgi:hypothetical protein